MVLAWFNTKEVDAVADRLVHDLKSRVPPGAEAATDKKQSARLDKAYVQVFGHAAEFAQAQPLNVYKKARLANRFKWALLEAGYAQEFVDDMTYRLAAVVASREKP